MQKIVLVVLGGLGLLYGAVPASAGSLEVVVSGIKTDKGEIGCALFATADGFPMDNAQAKQFWIPAANAGVTCVFENLPPGTYAVAVSHDLNGNKKLDTNFLGLPVEDWGVSNNARPSLRAPSFDEARFQISDSGKTAISIRIE